MDLLLDFSSVLALVCSSVKWGFHKALSKLEGKGAVQTNSYHLIPNDGQEDEAGNRDRILFPAEETEPEVPW